VLAVVVVIFAIVGAFFAAEVSLLALVCGLIATPFTLLFAILVGMTFGVAGGNDSLTMDWASGFASGPLAWAGAVISCTWKRLGRFLLSRGSRKESSNQPIDWPESMFGQSLSRYKREQARSGSLGTMFVITALLNCAGILILVFM
jgi:hypothetical protein